jgi:hypothetical protein
VDLRCARSQQRTGAFVDRGARRVDVVDERHRARPGTGCERIAHVAAARERVQAALRAHAARAGHERYDRQLPPEAELLGELRRRVGPAQQAPVAYGGHDGESLDQRARQLVGDERTGQARR